MGQRLNLEITYGSERIANCHYHWGAYAEDALYLADDAISSYYKFKSLFSDDKISARVLAIKMLLSTEAGFLESSYNKLNTVLSDQEIDILKQQLPKDGSLISKSRNHGLIEISEEGMDDTERWEEGRITLDIFNEQGFFYVGTEMTIEETFNEMQHWDDYFILDSDGKEIKTLNELHDFHEKQSFAKNIPSFRFSEIHDVINIVDGAVYIPTPLGFFLPLR